MEPFELSEEALRARRAVKWQRYPPDVLPAWVADMDFAVPDPVQQAVARVVEHREYGYGTGYGVRVGEEGLPAAFAEHMQARFGWTIDPALVVPVSELIQAIYCSLAVFTEPGDGVVVQTPIYPPFLASIADTGRRMVENRLLDDGTRYVLDADGLRRVVDDSTRVLLIANPHNPTGRVMEEAELRALGELAVERDLIIIADEIHADLVYPGREHRPMGTLGPEIAARTITITSATKGFNIPGLRCALMYFGSPELKARFHKVIPERMLGQVNNIGIDATVAAWRHGQPWLRAVMERLKANRDRLTEVLAAELPAVKYYPPEATYLAWLDCRALDLPTSPYQFFLERAKVGLNDGADFGEAGVGCVRLNFATSATIFEEILRRMVRAINS